MDLVPGQRAALEGEHDAGGKDRIEKGEGVPDQQQPFHAAMFGVMGVFAGEKVGAGLSARGPGGCLIHWFSSISRRKIASGDFTPPRVKYFPSATTPTLIHVVVLRDVPEPALFRHVSHGGGAGVEALVALRALVIGPDGDFVEERGP